MKYLKLLILLVSSFSAVNVSAQPIMRENLSIVNVHPMAVDRTHCSVCSGITRIYVNNGAWGESDCRRDAGDLYKEDDHILSTILFAWSTGKNLTIEVNDQVKPIDQVCKITAIFVSD